MHHSLHHRPRCCVFSTSIANYNNQTPSSSQLTCNSTSYSCRDKDGISIDKQEPANKLSLLRDRARRGMMAEARALFDSMQKKNLAAWTVLMSGYSAHGPAVEALSLFRDMLLLSLQPDPFVFSVALRACAASGDARLGRELHCAVLRAWFTEDPYVANALVAMYAGCGLIELSERVFSRIRWPNLVSWSSMMSGYIKNGRDDEALRLFHQMTWSGGVVLDAFVLSIVLKASANLLCTYLGIQIHCYMIKAGFSSNVFLLNSLLEFYGRIGRPSSMRRVFDSIVEKDLVSWNTMIAYYSGNFHGQDAVMLFRTLMLQGSECDRCTLGSILQAVTGLGALRHGMEIHGHVIRAGFDSDTHVISALLHMYVECMDPRTATYPMRIFGHFRSMGAEPDVFIMTSILKHCTSVCDIETGRMIHANIVKLQMKDDPHVLSSLIDMYAKSGQLQASLRLFKQIKDPGTAPWSVIIAAHCWNGQFGEALALLRKMQFDGIQANEFTYTSALRACIALGHIRTGKMVHCNVIRNGYESNASVLSTLIDLYLEYRLLKPALALCLMTSEQDVSWDMIIRALAEIGYQDKSVLTLVQKIQQSHGRISHASVHHVLSFCETPDHLDEAMQIHAFITKKGFTADRNINNALIKMYSNCGALELASNAFMEMPEKSSSSWNSMILASMQNGHPSKALELLTQMIRRAKSPSSETYICLLKACAHMGLVNEAFSLFISMKETYKITPSIEHYACMVEVLGLVGMVREAKHFMDSAMPLNQEPSNLNKLHIPGRMHD